MNRDFAVQELQALGMTVHPQFSRGSQGYVLTGYAGTFGQANVSFHVEYGEIQGLQLPAAVTATVGVPGNEIPMRFSFAGYEIKRRAGVTAPVTPQRIRVGGDIQAAKLFRQPAPVYPPLAKAARVSGRVTLNAVIGMDGDVQELSLESGHPLLVKAAMDAVKQWVYQPTLLNGERVEVVTAIDVNFTLAP